MNDIRLVGQVEAAGICESMVSLWWVYDESIYEYNWILDLVSLITQLWVA